MMKRIIGLFLTVILFGFLMTGCGEGSIKVGFIGDLSSGNSQLGVDARNGMEYYVNELNKNGGIKGSEVELVVKDNKGDQDLALVLHKEFIEEDVHFIVGDIISSMADTILESNSSELLFMTPTISSDSLSDKEDFIIRTSPIASRQADVFAEYATFRKADNMVIVYDLMNKDYTETVAVRAKQLLEDNGISVAGMVSYNSNESDLNKVVKEIDGLSPDNVFFLSVAKDTAVMVQNLKVSRKELGIYSVSWSMTNDLIQNGGKYVDGACFVGIYYPEDETSEYIDFFEGFEEYYGYEPSFVSVLAYDATKVLLSGMEEAQELTPKSVRDSVIEIGEFEGLQEVFSMDVYGDNDKQYMIYRLENNEFVPVRNWNEE